MGVESVCAVAGARSPMLWPTSYNRTKCCSPGCAAVHSLQSVRGVTLAFAQREMERSVKKDLDKIPSRNIVEKQRALLIKGL